MIRLLPLSLLAAALACGQTPALAPSPGLFFGFGASLQSSTTPHTSGWGALAFEVNKSQSIWSFSEIDFTVVRPRVGQYQIQTSPRTGAAILLRSFGSAHLLALGDAGASTTGNSTGAAWAGGGVATVPLGKKDSKWLLVIGVRLLKTPQGGTQTLAEIGFGGTR